jgi:hypothetical protein
MGSFLHKFLYTDAAEPGPALNCIELSEQTSDFVSDAPAASMQYICFHLFLYKSVVLSRIESIS